MLSLIKIVAGTNFILENFLRWSLLLRVTLTTIEHSFVQAAEYDECFRGQRYSM